MLIEKDLDLVEHSSRAGQFWVVDRKGKNNLVLLDTNHHSYGHGPEVYVNIQRLDDLKSSNKIIDPVLIHQK